MDEGPPIPQTTSPLWWTAPCSASPASALLPRHRSWSNLDSAQLPSKTRGSDISPSHLARSPGLHRNTPSAAAPVCPQPSVLRGQGPEDTGPQPGTSLQGPAHDSTINRWGQNLTCSQGLRRSGNPWLLPCFLSLDEGGLPGRKGTVLRARTQDTLPRRAHGQDRPSAWLPHFPSPPLPGPVRQVGRPAEEVKRFLRRLETPLLLGRLHWLPEGTQRS